MSDERNKVHKLQEQITSLLANLPQVLWSVDVVRNEPIYVSPSSRRICELDVDTPIPCLNWTMEEDWEAVRSAWERVLTGQQVEVESRVQGPEGELRWFLRVFQPYADETGRVVRIDGLMEDATEAKYTLERLYALATTDGLTGLSNRTLLLDRLNRAIAAARRGRPGKQVALLLMDLDHFKEINDTLGHPVGDDSAVLLPETDTARRTAEKVAGKLIECFNAPFQVGGQSLYLG